MRPADSRRLAHILSRCQGANIIHQQPNLTPGEPHTKSGHLPFAFADFPAERSISLLPQVRVREVCRTDVKVPCLATISFACGAMAGRSEEHTSELQSLRHLVCRL